MDTICESLRGTVPQCRAAVYYCVSGMLLAVAAAAAVGGLRELKIGN